MSFYDFTSNEKVTDLAGVPEQFKPYYKENDSKDGFVLDPTAKPLADAYVTVNKQKLAVAADKKASSDESAARRQAIKLMSDTMGELGVDTPDGTEPHEALKIFVGDLTEKVKGGTELKVNLDKVNAAAEKRVAEAVAAGDVKVDAMQSSLNKYMLTAEATTALSKHGVVEGGTDLLMAKIMSSAKIVKDTDGNYVPRVVDSQGEVRSDGAGGWVNIDHLVGVEMKKDFPMVFKSEAPSGPGTPPDKGTGGVRTPANNDTGNANSKIAAGLASLSK